MEKLTNEELIAMLVALYKKIEKLENKLDGRTRMMDDSSYLKELKQLAEKVNL